MAEDIKDISTRGALMAIAISLIVIAVVTTFGVFGDYAGRAPDKDKYQAVTLANGSVFFGELHGVGNDYVTLENAYSLQNAATDAKSTPKPQLVPRDKTGIKPVAAMKINSDQIVVWEDLQDDSPVTKAINEQQQN